MNKRILVLVSVMFFTFISFSAPKKAQAALADGTYSVNYTVLQGDSDSVSMANDYFDKPATLIVSGGKQSIELTVNHSTWITGLWVNSGSGLQTEQVIQTDAASDSRKARFAVTDLASPVAAKIKVDIDNESLNYHHDYKITLQFAMDSAALISGGSKVDASATSEATAGANKSKTPVNEQATTAKVANPKSGDTASITLYIGLFIVALIGLFTIKKTKKAY